MGSSGLSVSSRLFRYLVCFVYLVPLVCSVGFVGLVNQINERNETNEMNQMNELNETNEIHWRRNMRSLKGSAPILTVLILTFCLAVLLSLAPASAEEPMAQIARVAGGVWVKSESKAPAGEWVLIKTGNYPLYPGDTVKTSGGRAEILFSRDQSVIRVGEETQLLLRQTEGKEDGTNLRQIFLSLGWIWATINPRTGLQTQFESNAATAGIRGTSLQYWIDSTGTAFISCIDGGIDVTANGVTVSLTPGQCTRVTPGSEPAPPFACVAPPFPTVEDLVLVTPEEIGGPPPVFVAPSPLFQGTGGGGIASPHK